MGRNSPDIAISEVPGNKKTLEQVRKDALPYLSAHLLEVLRSLLDSGELEIKDGVIIPSPSYVKPVEVKVVSIEIYAICDPRSDDVVYVGKTKNGAQFRLQQHTWIGKPKIKAFIRRMRDMGLSPTVKILETVNDERIANEAEKRWIEFYITKGQLLLNTVYARNKKNSHAKP
jgi:hypothetical protein